MNLIRKIVRNWATWILKNRLKKQGRQRVVTNLGEARSVGLLFEATDQDVLEAVEKLADALRDKQIKVYCLGFESVKGKDEVLSKGHITYLNKSHINWMQLPKVKEASDFVERELDLLLDLSMGSCFPVQYLCAMSLAKFKAGCDKGYRKEYCDLTIDISQKENINYLIIQLKHYLKIINNNKNVA